VTLIVQLAALGMLGVAVAVWLARVPSARRRRERPPAGGQPPVRGDLGAMTELVTVGRSTAGDLHRRLRPLLREIATVELARRGVGLDRDPREARALLGEELWELVRLDRPPPDMRDAPGLTLAQLTALTERLEAL
jgi:hypothetical protein